MHNLFNLKSFFKFLSKNISYTLIDVFGLSISLMFVILIAIYTIQELSTDNFQEKAEHIYAMTTEDGYGSAYRLADRLIERYPEMERTCVMTTHVSPAPANYGARQIDTHLLFADSTFFNMFSFELIQGDRNTVLEAKSNAVISRSFALKAFPDRDPIGQVVKLREDFSVTITGIMEDIKNSVVQSGDMLIRMDNIGVFNSGMDSQSYNNAGSAVIFVQTKPGTNIHERETEVADYFREIFWMFQRGIRNEIYFVPLKDVYFSPQDSYGLINKGDWKFVMILMSIGIVILVFAIINYINLTVAQTGFRAKEMATRRLLGSSRWDLFARLMLESTALTFISFLLGLFFAFLFVPFANDLLETKIYLSTMFTPLIILLTLIVIISIGVISGLLPAIIISNTKPVDVVKGGFRQKTKMVFSKFFITFQNVITITLIAVSITLISQIDHLINAPLGYNKSNIIDIGAYQLNMDQAIKLGKELEQLACVKQVGYSQGTPFSRGNNNTVQYEGRNISFQTINCDPGFVEMLKLNIIKDNQLANQDGFYLTQQALRELNISDDVPSVTTDDGWVITIAGVVEDFYLGNITSDLRPTLVGIKKAEDLPWRSIWNVLVEIEGDHRSGFAQVKAVYENLFDQELPAKFVDAQIQESFASEERTSRIVMVFTFIAILISMLGLYAMSTYFIQQRAREVAVRKVFGSTNTKVLIKLVSNFLNYVLVAFVIAIPLIWYFMNDWLSGYNYRITLAPWIYLAAFTFCLLLSLVSVYFQSRMAANRNPAHSIKSE